MVDIPNYPYGWIAPNGLGFAYVPASHDVVSHAMADQLRLVCENYGTVDVDPPGDVWFCNTLVGRLTFGVEIKKSNAKSMAEAGPRLYMRAINRRNKHELILCNIMTHLRQYVNEFCPPRS